MPRGGKREGAGRPLGSTKEIVRRNKTMKAYDDEWELIQRFARMLKHGHRPECENFLNSMLGETL